MIVVHDVDLLRLECDADDNVLLQLICSHSNRAWESYRTLKRLLLLLDAGWRGDIECFWQWLEAIRHLWERSLSRCKLFEECLVHRRRFLSECDKVESPLVGRRPRHLRCAISRSPQRPRRLAGWATLRSMLQSYSRGTGCRPALAT